MEMIKVNITVKQSSVIGNFDDCKVKWNYTAEVNPFNYSSSDDHVIIKLVDNPNNVTVLVSGLDPFTNYTFYVLAVTVTPSEPSDSVTVFTDEGGE